MENQNELQRVMGSKTAEMVAQILRGETPQAPEAPVVADKTEADILRAVSDTYREILQPKAAEGESKNV
jgi:hypothetical protein